MMKKKIAIIFRGLLRPNYDIAMHCVNMQLAQFDREKYDYDTWLVTWKDHRDLKASEFLHLNRDTFDNAIILTPPSDERCAQVIPTELYRNDYRHGRHGAYHRSHIVNPYYQTKSALDLVIQNKDYDYIVNSRLDLTINWGEHLDSWFDPDWYVSPWTGVPWINDWISIARPDVMHRAWNYKDLPNLARIISQSTIPEHILMKIMEEAGVMGRMGSFVQNDLHPSRFD